MTGQERHAAVCGQLNDLYIRKNHDYGDSFHQGWVKYGLLMLVIRLGDKFSRLESLILRKKRAQVTEESIRDTLIDLANYAIMGIMELDAQEGEQHENHKTEL